MPLKVAAFGSISQVYAIRRRLPEITREFGIEAVSELHTYAARPELAGHVLVQAEWQEGTQVTTAAGCAVDPDTAGYALAGELIERRMFHTWVPSAVRTASAEELARTGKSVLDVAGLVGRPLHPDRWPHPRFDPQGVYQWTPGFTRAGNRPILVPAGVVSTADAHASSAFVELTSSGMAVGATVEDATIRALDELTERDCLIRTWYGWLGWDAVAELDGDGWRTALLGGPVTGGWFVTAVTFRTGPEPIGAIGAAVRRTREHAAEHALAEAVMMRFAATIHRGGEASAFSTRTAHYSSHDGLAALARFVHGSRSAAAAPVASTDTVVVPMSTTFPAAVRVIASGLLAAESAPRSARVPRSVAGPDPQWHLAHPHPLG